jgi:hypothetical protein
MWNNLWKNLTTVLDLTDAKDLTGSENYCVAIFAYISANKESLTCDISDHQICRDIMKKFSQLLKKEYEKNKSICGGVGRI